MTETSDIFELEPQRRFHAAAPVADGLIESAIEGRAHSTPTAVWLDNCVPFEAFTVVTSRNVYDVVVLPGRHGQVLVRGGRFFPEFRHAILVGSTGGGSALKMNRIEVGLRMEFRLDDRTVTTSRVHSLAAVN